MATKKKCCYIVLFVCAFVWLPKLLANPYPTMRPVEEKPRFSESPRKRVLMAMAYYEHRMHRGVAVYASRASWVLDTTMAHYGTPPTHWRGDGVLALTLPDRPDLTRFSNALRSPRRCSYGALKKHRGPRGPLAVWADPSRSIADQDDGAQSRVPATAAGWPNCSRTTTPELRREFPELVAICPS